MVSDDLCNGFVPQVWKKERCKKCFRLREKHGTEFRSSPSGGGGNSTKSNLHLKTTQANYERSKSGPVSAAGQTPASGLQQQNSGYAWRRKVYGPPITNSSGSIVTNSSSSNDSGSSASPPSSLVIPVLVDGPSSNSIDSPHRDMNKRTSPSVARRTPQYANRTDSSIRTRTPPSPSQNNKSQMDETASQRSFASVATLTGSQDSLHKTVSYESVVTAVSNDTKSMITALSGSSLKSARSGEENGRGGSESGSSGSSRGTDRSCTPMEGGIEDSNLVKQLRSQLDVLEKKCAKLELENKRMYNNSGGQGQRSNERPNLGRSRLDKPEKYIRDLEEKLAAAESLYQDYRDENTVLKCELTELQEAVSKSADQSSRELKDKLAAAESLCEELMDENDGLKKEIQSLQTEIEELQDQYREHEISEFRELQRELELTAKNCRVLQFKLRKAERKTDDCTEADQCSVEADERMKNLVNSIKGSETDALQLKTELGIAKEVSVRLHNELELLEEKRMSLEDENFSLKERIGDLERKQREVITAGAIHGSGGKTPNTEGAEKLLRGLEDAIERETDLKEQLKFAESDVEMMRKKLSDLETENEGLVQQLAKFTSSRYSSRPPMVRSASEGHAQIQLELAEHENTVLKRKLTRAEQENEKAFSRVSLLEKEVQKVGGKHVFSDLELQSAIPDTYYKQKVKILEEEMEELRLRLENCQKPEAEQGSPGSSAHLTYLRRRAFIQASKSRSLETGPNSFNSITTSSSASAIQVGAQSHNQSRKQLLIAEQELTLLRAKNERLSNENQRLREEKKRLTGACGGASSATSSTPRSEVRPEQAEQMQKDIHEFICRISALEAENSKLKSQISAQNSTPAPTPDVNVKRTSSGSRLLQDKGVDEVNKDQGNETELQKQIKELSTALKTAEDEKKEATERLLHSETRWSKELETNKIEYEEKLKKLTEKLEETEKLKNENAGVIQEKTCSITEKVRKISLLEDRVEKLTAELEQKTKELDTKVDAERKKANGFETRYSKLESLFEGEKEKFATEKEKAKAELSNLKKSVESAKLESEGLRKKLEVKEAEWASTKKHLEKEFQEKKEALMNVEGVLSQDEKLEAEIGKLKTEQNRANELWRKKEEQLEQELDEESRRADRLSEEMSKMVKEQTILLDKVQDQREQLTDMKTARDRAKEELSRWQQTWTRERAELSHKLRQEAKIQQASQNALQLKYESRIRVLEESSKRLQSQLAQARHERDQHKNQLSLMESKVESLQKQHSSESAGLNEKTQTLNKALAELETAQEELRAAKSELETFKKLTEQEKALWKIEKQKLEMTNAKSLDLMTASAESDLKDLLKSSTQTAQELHASLEDSQKSHSETVLKLTAKYDKEKGELCRKNAESERKLREALEKLKICEIDRRNKACDLQDVEQERNRVIADRDDLLGKLHEFEVHILAYKYKLDKIADLMAESQTKLKYSNGSSSGESSKSVSEIEQSSVYKTIQKAYDQLSKIREEMSKAKEIGKFSLNTEQRSERTGLGKGSSVLKATDSLKNGRKNSIEYDDEGKRHWAEERKALRRSVSMDPTGGELDIVQTAKLIQHHMGHNAPSASDISDASYSCGVPKPHKKASTISQGSTKEQNGMMDISITSDPVVPEPGPVSKPGEPSDSSSSGDSKKKGSTVKSQGRRGRSPSKRSAKPTSKVAAMIEKFGRGSRSRSRGAETENSVVMETNEGASKDKRKKFGASKAVSMDTGADMSVNVKKTTNTIRAPRAAVRAAESLEESKRNGVQMRSKFNTKQNKIARHSQSLDCVDLTSKLAEMEDIENKLKARRSFLGKNSMLYRSFRSLSKPRWFH